MKSSSFDSVCEVPVEKSASLSPASCSAVANFASAFSSSIDLNNASDGSCKAFTPFSVARSSFASDAGVTTTFGIMLSEPACTSSVSICPSEPSHTNCLANFVGSYGHICDMCKSDVLKSSQSCSISFCTAREALLLANLALSPVRKTLKRSELLEPSLPFLDAFSDSNPYFGLPRLRIWNELKACAAGPCPRFQDGEALSGGANFEHRSASPASPISVTMSSSAASIASREMALLSSSVKSLPRKAASIASRAFALHSASDKSLPSKAASRASHALDLISSPLKSLTKRATSIASRAFALLSSSLKPVPSRATSMA
mmetsp:Transcript_54778/g.86712  ORF Transcript_54778/g.86712 Transcript_54778/m.86712 type:complete len:317 (-) Transcript_54778:45-995(-)